MKFFSKVSRRKRLPKPVLLTIGDALLQDDPDQSLWIAMVDLVFASEGEPILENLSQPCQVLYLIELVEREVNNGGFEQFFHNAGGNFTAEARVAIKELKLAKLLSLLNEACSHFPDGVVPKDQYLRKTLLCEALEKNENVFSEIDDKYNQLANSRVALKNEPENPSVVARLYMNEHADQPIAAVAIGCFEK
ncbi:MAG: DUF4375 domain-containing protein [Candidatus Obscuribacterales bacterium]